MIALMDLRAGNYIHPHGNDESLPAEDKRYLRILSVDLTGKKVRAKEDYNTEILTFEAAQISGCSITDLLKIMGGFSFNEHSILIKGEHEVFIIHENGSTITLPHIQYVHQFQNLFRSLTGEELPFNIRYQQV